MLSFPTLLVADKTAFLKKGVAAAGDWGKSCVGFDLYIHPLSAMVGSV